MKLIATNCALLVAVASVLVIMQASTFTTTAAAAAPNKVQRHPKKVVFEKLEFESDTEWVEIEEAITMVGTETAVNIQSNVKKSVPDDALINVVVSKENAPGEFTMFLRSGDVPVCGLLKNATETQPLFKGMILRLLEFSNIPYQCPLPVGQFWLKEFVIDSTAIPEFIPEGRYKVDVGIYRPPPQHQLIYKSEIIFALVPRM